jgi:phosphatidate cytidylyltransferase
MSNTMSNTTLRIIVSVIAVPIIIFLVIQGGWPFFLFVEALALLTLRELYSFAAQKGYAPMNVLGYVACGGIGAIIFAENALTPAVYGFALIAVVTIFTLLVLAVELWRNNATPLVNAATTIFGTMYIAVFMNALVGLRMMFFQSFAQPLMQASMRSAITSEVSSSAANGYLADAWGIALVMCVFVGIWTCDTTAFFAGKAFGRHKLFPRVSPNKSWEGAVVGFLASAAAVGAVAHYFLPFLPLVHAASIGALVGVVGQIGDLVESLFKRDAGVKDSSNLIPGHGGVFDRFDAVLFAAPVTYLYVKAYLLFGLVGV